MRLYRFTLVSGLAIGYVLGAQAGRERYEQMRKMVRSVADSPAVQQAAGALHAQATGTMKSTWNMAAAGARKGVSRVRGQQAPPPPPRSRPSGRPVRHDVRQWLRTKAGA